MQIIRSIGNVGWTNEEIRNHVEEFLQLYDKRPIRRNDGGMKLPHLFATWFMLKQLQPSVVIESGIWKGQSTWLIEQTLPFASLYSLDIDLSNREYISSRATYFEKDFKKIDWSFIQDKDNALLFLDDHQNAFERLKFAKELGFRNFIFEDNYPAGHGDCYSLKHVLQEAGFNPPVNYKGVKGLLRKLLSAGSNGKIPPNKEHMNFLKENLALYYEFPPVFKSELTRWNDTWLDHKYPTPAALYERIEHEYLRPFYDEALNYTWICFAQVRPML